MNSKKLLMAALAAMFVLSLGVGSAAALRSIGLEGAGPERTSTLEGRVTFAGGGIEIICNVTMQKTLSRIIPKTEGVLIGQVTSVRVQAPELCTIRGAERLNGITILGLPGSREGRPELWRIFYKSFLGTLPSPTGFLFELQHTQVLLGVRVFGFNVSCLFEGTVPVLAEVGTEPRGATNIIRTLRTLRNNLPLLRGEFGCPAEGSFNTTNMEQAAGQRIRITLL
jgi:hypothetical protein